MKCKICLSEAKLVKTLTVREIYKAEYFLCDTCGFMFVGNPTWLEEAYQSPINITDTGYVMRNVYLSRKSLILFTLMFGKDKTYLDYGGGYGMLTRLMRDYGLNFLWDDIYTQNLFAKGFEYHVKNSTAPDSTTLPKIEGLTTFECFEHLPNPKEEIEKMFKITNNIFFSTVLLPGQVPPADDWEYYGLNHGQHVAFYSEKTLKYIAKQHGVQVLTNGTNLHLFTDKMTISNSLFKTLMFATKVELDLFIRKLFLTTKTYSDNKELKAKGYK